MSCCALCKSKLSLVISHVEELKTELLVVSRRVKEIQEKLGPLDDEIKFIYNGCNHGLDQSVNEEQGVASDEIVQEERVQEETVEEEIVQEETAQEGTVKEETVKETFKSMDIREITLNPESYENYWNLAVDKEKNEYLKALANKSITNIKLIEFKTDKKGEIVEVVITLPSDHCGEKPVADELIKISQGQWSILGKVKNVTGFKAPMVFLYFRTKPEQPPQRNGKFTLTYVPNLFSFNRMKVYYNINIDNQG